MKPTIQKALLRVWIYKNGQVRVEDYWDFSFQTMTVAYDLISSCVSNLDWNIIKKLEENCSSGKCANCAVINFSWIFK